MATKKKPVSKAKEVKFKYYIPDEYRPVYSNAVWGGVNVKGELEIHFLYDRNPLPLYSTHEVKKGVLLGTPKDAKIGESVLRFVQTGVVMTPDSARSLYEWLEEKLKMLEKKPDEKH